MSATSPRIEALGESALLLRLDPDMPLERANDRVHAIVAALARARPPAVQDVVPAFASLAVLFDGGSDPAQARADVRAWLAGTATAVAGAMMTGAAAAGRLHRIEVAFGGSHGPDLEPLARHAGCTPDEVVGRFCAPEYRVAMLGFAPGFPYLLGLDPVLAMPRLDTPRAEVPGGSVAIADRQAGIYPQRGPGGWRLLGHASAALFDAARSPPALLAAGDRIRFVAS